MKCLSGLLPAYCLALYIGFCSGATVKDHTLAEKTGAVAEIPESLVVDDNDLDLNKKYATESKAVTIFCLGTYVLVRATLRGWVIGLSHVYRKIHLCRNMPVLGLFILSAKFTFYTGLFLWCLIIMHPEWRVLGGGYLPIVPISGRKYIWLYVDYRSIVSLIYSALIDVSNKVIGYVLLVMHTFHPLSSPRREAKADSVRECLVPRLSWIGFTNAVSLFFTWTVLQELLFTSPYRMYKEIPVAFTMGVFFVYTAEMFCFVKGGIMVKNMEEYERYISVVNIVITGKFIYDTGFGLFKTLVLTGTGLVYAFDRSNGILNLLENTSKTTLILANVVSATW